MLTEAKGRPNPVILGLRIRLRNYLPVVQGDLKHLRDARGWPERWIWWFNTYLWPWEDSGVWWLYYAVSNVAGMERAMCPRGTWKRRNAQAAPSGYKFHITRHSTPITPDIFGRFSPRKQKKGQGSTEDGIKAGAKQEYLILKFT